MGQLPLWREPEFNSSAPSGKAEGDSSEVKRLPVPLQACVEGVEAILAENVCRRGLRPGGMQGTGGLGRPRLRPPQAAAARPGLRPSRGTAGSRNTNTCRLQTAWKGDLQDDCRKSVPKVKHSHL